MTQRDMGKRLKVGEAGNTQSMFKVSLAFSSPLGRWVLVQKKKAIATHGMEMWPTSVFRRSTQVIVQWKWDEIQSERPFGKFLFVSRLFVVVRLTAAKDTGNQDEESVICMNGVCRQRKETDFTVANCG